MRISDWSSDVCSSDLEGLDVAFSEMLGLGVEQPSVRTAHTIRPERLFEFVRLKQDGKTGQRALRSRRGSERTQRRPEVLRSEEHTSELQSLMRISYAVFCLKKKTITKKKTNSRDKRT